jgi:hypothetical protein
MAVEAMGGTLDLLDDARCEGPTRNVTRRTGWREQMTRTYRDPEGIVESSYQETGWKRRETRSSGGCAWVALFPMGTMICV